LAPHSRRPWRQGLVPLAPRNRHGRWPLNPDVYSEMPKALSGWGMGSGYYERGHMPADKCDSVLASFIYDKSSMNIPILTTTLVMQEKRP